MSEPVRMCLGCRAREPKASLVRLAWDARAAAVVLDASQTAPGRGAYLHPGCARAAQRRVGHALRRPVDPAQVGDLIGVLAD